MPETIADRSILVSMRRKRADEQVERFQARTHLGHIKAKAARWTMDHTITFIDDDYLPGLNDRAADNWEALVAITRMAGDKWLSLAKKAAYALSAAEEDDDADVGVMLLSDIQEVLGNEPAMFSANLVNRLVELEGRPWADWRRGQPMTQSSLAKLLKDCKKPNGRAIKPQQMRIGSITKKGYRMEWFDDALNRYVRQDTPRTMRNTETSQRWRGFRRF
jgi:hypothetical protein